MSGFGSITAGSDLILTSISASAITGSTVLFTTVNSTTITGSTITGSTALFTTITGSDISSSATLQVGTTLTVGTGVNVGGGSPVTKMKLYSVNFTGFNSINGNSTSQQTGAYAANSFSGMSTNDTLFVNGLGAQWATSPIVISSITASAAGPLFTFRNTTSSAATPPLGIYKIFAITT